jgi:hypothetical protein
MNSSAARLHALELKVRGSSAERPLYFHGLSMTPLLVEGDEVLVVPVSWAELRIGDIVTYRFEDRFPTRRIVRKTGDRLVLWCDAWPRERFYARRGDVLGRAVGRLRDGEWLRVDDEEWQRLRREAIVKFRADEARRRWRAFRRLVRRARGRSRR